MKKNESSMQPKISYSTVQKVSTLSKMPVSRGFEKALLKILEEYEKQNEKTKELK